MKQISYTLHRIVVSKNTLVCSNDITHSSGVSRNSCRGVLDSAHAKRARNFLRPRPFLWITPTILSGHAHFEVCTMKN